MKKNDSKNMPSKENNGGYICQKCQDTGWLLTDSGAAPCLCRRENRIKARIKRANISPALSAHSFDLFDLDFYPQFLALDGDNGKDVFEARKLAKEALMACKEFVALIRQNKSPRSLIFQGDVGRGKTFLAAAIANELLKNDVDLLFLVMPEFLDELRFSYQDGGEFNEAEIMQRAEKAGVLILDDLGAHNYSDWTRNKIFTLLNYRLNHQLPCVITTNLSIKEINNVIGTRFISRLSEMCDFYFLISGEDYRMKNQSK